MSPHSGVADSVLDGNNFWMIFKNERKSWWTISIIEWFLKMNKKVGCERKLFMNDFKKWTEKGQWTKSIFERFYEMNEKYFSNGFNSEQKIRWTKMILKMNRKYKVEQNFSWTILKNEQKKSSERKPISEQL